jgi:hypothetical protein
MSERAAVSGELESSDELHVGVPPVLTPEITALLACSAVVVATHFRRPPAGIWAPSTVPDGAVAPPWTQVSLITRLLESLERQHEPPHTVIVLIMSTEPGTELSAIWNADHVRSRFPNLPEIAIWTPTHVRTLQAILRASGRGAWAAYFDTNGYPRIRNMQLLLPYLLGFKLVVALDDDEVAEDRYFLRRAAASIAHGTAEGSRVFGAAGYYLDEHGRYLHEVSAAEAADSNPFEHKMALMNGRLAGIEAQPGTVVPTFFALGGNMTFSRSLIAQVGFDPAIARGEDIDYVLNAALLGVPYHFDKERPIRHLPPPGRSYKDFDYAKLQLDVQRFIYEREKLRAAAADGGFSVPSLADLHPYPGQLLGDDVEAWALASLRRHRPAIVDNAFVEPEAFVTDAIAIAKHYAEEFLVFLRAWPQALAAMSADHAIQHIARSILRKPR